MLGAASFYFWKDVFHRSGTLEKENWRWKDVFHLSSANRG
jgi:hypothetical protein